MRHYRAWVGALAVAWLITAGVLLLGCGTVSRTVNVPLKIEGAHTVGNQACADCHGDILRKFPASPHARVLVASESSKLDTSCESCHGPASKHVEAGHGFILNPRKDASVCFQCHLGVHAEFKLPHHHPVIEDKLNCIQCHDPHGHDISKPAGGLAMARLNEGCAQCHREQSRVFVFEHPAMREGCVACHQPHGSVNAKLLVQRDSGLCLKCHAQMPGPSGGVFIGKEDHTYYLRQGSCWSAGCHGAVHGSNISSKLQY